MDSTHYDVVDGDHDGQSRMPRWEFRTVYSSDPTYLVEKSESTTRHSTLDR